MEARRFRTYLLRDLPQQLFLCRTLVDVDVVDLALRPSAFEREHQSLHHVRDIDEGNRVSTRADDDGLPRQQTISDAPEVQVVARSKDRARPNDARRQLLLQN